MTVLVTGASGLIGSRLIPRLHDRQIFVLVRPEGARRPIPIGLKPIAVDMLNAEAIRQVMLRCKPDVVFHCAMSSGHPSNAAERLEALAIAVHGTANLAEAAAEAGVRRFVHLGSFLGYRPQHRAIREDDPIEPSTARGAAKAAASMWLRQFAKAMAFSAVELRIFSVYGPGEADHRFVPTLLRAARDGTAVRLLAGVSRDMVYVDDVVDACLAAADATCSAGSVFNIGSGEACTNEQLVRAVEAVCGRPVRISADLYPGKAADGEWLADTSMARSILGWHPQWTLHDGLTEAYACLK